MDNAMRVPVPVTTPVTELRNPPDPHVDPYAQTTSKKRNKPLMEKRRRQRINHAVEELRRLVTDPTTKTASKLEKADILDLTVKFVKDSLASQRTPPPQPYPTPNMQLFLQGHMACEMTLRRLLDQHIPKQTTNAQADTSVQLMINHMLKELSTNRQQLLGRRCSNSAFSPVMSSVSSSTSNSIRPPFASPSGNSSTSTDSFPDLSPTQMDVVPGFVMDHRLGFPFQNSTPCSRVGHAAVPEVPKGADDLSSTATTTQLWRPW